MTCVEAPALPGAPRVHRLAPLSGGQAVVPLPANWINAVEAGASLTAVDRRVWLVLLAHSWPLDPAAPVYSIAAASLREAVGMTRSRSNTRLLGSIERLSGLGLHSLAANGWSTPLFTDLGMSPCGARVVWRFDPGAVRIGLGSSGWMRVDLALLGQLSGARAARLYCLLGLRAGLRGRFWSVYAGDLRRLLAPDQDWGHWSDFSKAVLSPAVASVERVTGWRIGVSVVRESGTRHVVKVRFSIG